LGGGVFGLGFVVGLFGFGLGEVSWGDSICFGVEEKGGDGFMLCYAAQDRARGAEGHTWSLALPVKDATPD
jgi:hypothetical protein